MMHGQKNIKYSILFFAPCPIFAAFL